MSPNKRRLTKKEESYSFLDQLNTEKDDWIIKVRVARFWEVISSGSREPISTDMVLIDERGVLIHATIKNTFGHRFVGLLTEGGLYVLKNFSVVNNKEQWRVVGDNKLMIQFYSSTIVEEVQKDDGKILRHKFEFIAFHKIELRMDNHYVLTDLIGRVASEGNVQTKTIRERKRTTETMIIELEDLRNTRIKVTLWGEKIEEYKKQVASLDGDIRIIIVTSTIVKKFLERPSVSTSPSTRIYINPNIPEVEEYMEQFRKNKDDMKIATLDDTFIGISVVEMQNKYKNIFALLEFVETNYSGEHTFFCAAKIMDFVATKKSWYYYMSCECKTGLSNSGGGFYCPKCEITTQEPIPRYRIETKVEDDGGATIFTLFGKEAEKLIGQSCSMLYDIEVSNDKDDNGGPHIPALIKNLIGTTHVFQVKATQYNKNAKRQTFSVSRIYPHDILDNKEDKGEENGVTQEKSSETKGVVAKRNKSIIIDEEEETLPNTNQNGEATIIKRAKLKAPQLEESDEE